MSDIQQFRVSQPTELVGEQKCSYNPHTRYLASAKGDTTELQSNTRITSSENDLSELSTLTGAKDTCSYQQYSAADSALGDALNQLGDLSNSIEDSISELQTLPNNRDSNKHARLARSQSEVVAPLRRGLLNSTDRRIRTASYLLAQSQSLSINEADEIKYDEGGKSINLLCSKDTHTTDKPHTEHESYAIDKQNADPLVTVVPGQETINLCRSKRISSESALVSSEKNRLVSDLDKKVSDPTIRVRKSTRVLKETSTSELNRSPRLSHKPRPLQYYPIQSDHTSIETDFNPAGNVPANIIALNSGIRSINKPRLPALIHSESSSDEAYILNPKQGYRLTSNKQESLVKIIAKVPVHLQSFSSTPSGSLASSCASSRHSSTETLTGIQINSASDYLMQTDSQEARDAEIVFQVESDSDLTDRGMEISDTQIDNSSLSPSLKSKPKLPSFILETPKRASLGKSVSDNTGERIRAAMLSLETDGSPPNSVLREDFLSKYSRITGSQHSTPYSISVTPSSVTSPPLSPGIKSPCSDVTSNTAVSRALKLRRITEKLLSKKLERFKSVDEFSNIPESHSRKQMSMSLGEKDLRERSLTLPLRCSSAPKEMHTNASICKSPSEDVLGRTVAEIIDSVDTADCEVVGDGTEGTTLSEDEVFKCKDDDKEVDDEEDEGVDADGISTPCGLSHITFDRGTPSFLEYGQINAVRNRRFATVAQNVIDSRSKCDTRKLKPKDTVQNILSSARRDRSQRRSDSDTGTKTTSVRYLTHPPDAVKKEGVGDDTGIKDTNGFSPLQSCAAHDLGRGGKLGTQDSEQSLADSNFCPSEDSDTFTDAYNDEFEIIKIDVEYSLSRKDSKSLKYKSKSDPSSETVDIGAITAGNIHISSSSPELCEDNSGEFEQLNADSRLQSKSDDNALSEPPKSDQVEDTHNRSELVLENTTEKCDDQLLTVPNTNTPQEKRPQTLALDNTLGSRQLVRSKSSAQASTIKDGHSKTQMLSSSNSFRLPRSTSEISALRCPAYSYPELRSPGQDANSKDVARQSSVKNIIQDKRYHIVNELFTVEKEFVESLRILVEKYIIPLKTNGQILETDMVDNIFYKTMIPEIRTHHELFMAFLGNAWETWDSKTTTVGDVINGTFSKQSVIDSYMLFIKHFKRSEKMIDHCLQTKSSFQKFDEQCQRENRFKLPLKGLIIKVVQRLPRYQLLLTRLINNTPVNHPDQPKLLEAERSISDLAKKIDSVNKARDGEERLETLKKLELLLYADLAVPDRVFLRHDMVSMLTKKDQCCIWMFSDLIIFSTVKRKSGTISRKTSLMVQSPTGQSHFVENIKHKLWFKIGLDDLEIINSPDTLSRKRLKEKDIIEADVEVVNQLLVLSQKLTWDHQSIDDSISDMTNTLNNRLTELQVKNVPTDMTKIELVATTPDGVTTFPVIFQSSEKRANWEASFQDAKQKLATVTDRKPPEFLQPLQITKTRAGMQFSCAAPTDCVGPNGYRDVWVCNSDGYVGHMCLLSLQPDPIVTLNTLVPGCNSRILCICAIPAFSGPLKRKGSGKHTGTNTEADQSQSNVELLVTDTSDNDEESSSSEDEGVNMGSPPGAQEAGAQSPREHMKLDPLKSTMWLGTDNGYIHIFSTLDNIKTTKNKLKLQHAASVLSIVHLDSKVFVSLANGDLVVYKRGPDCCWDTTNPEVRVMGSATTPVSKMIAVAGKLWCASQTTITVFNPNSLVNEVSFQVNSDSNRQIQCMAYCGHGVWIATQNSAKVLLYHATHHQYLMEVNIAQAVGQKLLATDDIIRQHKTACLRITSLLACKDLLWIGTSAGVILTLPLPKITSSTSKTSLSPPPVTGLVHGHTGHVRFLTAVDMPTFGLQQTVPSLTTRRRSLGGINTLATQMMLISGGDGYEDFRSNPNNETAGRDDSTNHLLLWQV